MQRFSAFGHTGWDVGYVSAFLNFPEQHVSVAMMTNAESYDGLIKLLSDAAAAARVAYPNRRAYIMRIGHRAAIHMGGML